MVMPTLRIATICSGIGAPEKALRQLGIDYKTEYFSEFDKYTSKSYCAIHGEDATKNLGDLTKIDIGKLPKDGDLIVGGTPCQDFSIAGRRAGGEADSETRSSLMWNFVEIIHETKPKVVLWENVPGCLSGEMYPNYRKFISTLSELGYENRAEVLNAKQFAIPQNRDRVFVLATRKDLGLKFKMPVGYDCGIRLKDILESEVAEKFYLSEQFIRGLFSHKERHNGKGTGFGWKPTDPEKHAACLHANSSLAPTDNTLIEHTQGKPQGYRVYDTAGVSVTRASQAGGGGAKTGLYVVPRGDNKGGCREVENCPSITVSAFEQNNFIIDIYNKSLRKDGNAGTITAVGTSTGGCGTFAVIESHEPKCINSKVNGKQPKVQDRIYDSTAVSTAVTTAFMPSITEKTEGIGNGKTTTLHETKTVEQILSNPEHGDTLTVASMAYVFLNGQWVRIRKLTPRECFRLMGFSDTDFDACKAAGLSDSQLYKQAGNSIVVNVLMAIFGELYGVPWKEKVYGKYWKTEHERLYDLPMFQALGGNE